MVMRLFNLKDVPVSIPKGTTVATMELLPNKQQVEEQQTVPDGVQDRLWAMVEHAGSQLTPTQMKELFKHDIDTAEAKPIQQQVRRIPSE